MPAAAAASSITALPLAVEPDPIPALGLEHASRPRPARGAPAPAAPRPGPRSPPPPARPPPAAPRALLGHDPPCGQQHHPVGRLRLGEIVGGEENRGAPLAPLGRRGWSRSSSRCSGSRPTVGSSRIRRSGRCSVARAISSEPPPSAGELPRELRGPRPEAGAIDRRSDGGAQSRGRPARPAARRTAGSPRPSGGRRRWSPGTRGRAAAGRGRARARRRGRTRGRRRGSGASRVASSSIAVVLPAPLGPSRPTSAPAGDGERQAHRAPGRRRSRARALGFDRRRGPLTRAAAGSAKSR